MNEKVRAGLSGAHPLEDSLEDKVHVGSRIEMAGHGTTLCSTKHSPLQHNPWPELCSAQTL
jgi:hypothetical protein